MSASLVEEIVFADVGCVQHIVWQDIGCKVDALIVAQCEWPVVVGAFNDPPNAGERARAVSGAISGILVAGIYLSRSKPRSE